jgi:hypothetical protein
MGTVEQDKQEVVEVLEQYRCGCTTLDVATLTAMWDQRYDQSGARKLRVPANSKRGSWCSSKTDFASGRRGSSGRGW